MKICRMCDAEDIQEAAVCEKDGEKRYICVGCVRGILTTLGIQVQNECDHFHEEDAQEIAGEVERFFDGS